VGTYVYQCDYNAFNVIDTIKTTTILS